MDPSIFSQLNWLAVLVATIVWFFVGAIWYSALFQKQWVAYHNINMADPDMKKGSGKIFFFSFVLMFIAATGLALLVQRLDLVVWQSGLKLGLLTGVCFALTAISVTYLYLKKPLGLHAIDALYHVVGHVIMAIILCLWR